MIQQMGRIKKKSDIFLFKLLEFELREIKKKIEYETKEDKKYRIAIKRP